MHALANTRSKAGWAAASVFFCAGLLLTADLLILSMGNWVFAALVVLLWILPSPLWVSRRDVAASFYLPVWLALAWFVAVTYKALFPLMPLKLGLSFMVIQTIGLSAPLLLAATAVPIVRTLRERRAWKPPALLVCPLLLLGAKAIVMRFGDVTRTAEHQMEWTADRDQLASLTGEPLPPLERLRSSALAQVNDEALVLLYRKVGNGYCIQPVFSDRLIAYLHGHGRAQVRVTYSLHYSFGQYRGEQGILWVDGYSMRQPGASFLVGNVPVGTDCGLSR